MASDGYHRGYVSFAHFLLYFWNISAISVRKWDAKIGQFSHISLVYASKTYPNEAEALLF